MGYSFRLVAWVPTDRISHTTAFVTPVMNHWLEQEIVQSVHHEGSIRRPITPRADTLSQSSISLFHLAAPPSCFSSRSTWIQKEIYYYIPIALFLLLTPGEGDTERNLLFHTHRFILIVNSR